ncbi:MAG TPA: ATP F0F1 synthase subunit B [Beijerinckiaceae bacterium]|nr:ATP F0F1 synthase subunit B [Beijerinckiaceae bacterium]
MRLDAEVFVAIAFLLFVAAVIYFGLHNKINEMLDARAAAIKAELDEAARLRAEAAALLQSFEQKKIAAEADAENIVAQARVEAELIAKEAHERMAEFVERRKQQAEQKIAMAEQQATADVRAAAADAAVRAAAIVLKDEAKGEVGDQLVRDGIAGLKSLAH